MEVLAGDLNPHFFHWPSLTFYLFAALFGLVRLIRRLLFLDPSFSPATATILARSLVALAGTVTLIVQFRLARRSADAATGLVAAAFLAVAILHVRDSHFAMTDVLMTLLVTASLSALVGALPPEDGSHETAFRRKATPVDRRFAVAGLLGGLATSTKYNAGAILAAMAAAQLLLLARSKERPWSARAWLPSVAFAAAFTGGFIAGTPFAVLDFDKFSEDLLFDFTHLSGGHGIDLGRGWVYHLTRSLPYGCGLPIFVAALPGIPLLLWRHPRQAFVIGAFAVAFYAGIGSGSTVFFRYVLPLVPIVCLLAAVAVQQAATWLAPRVALRECTAIAMLAALVGAAPLANVIWFDLLLARTDTRVLAGAWLAARIQPGESLHDAGGDYARLELGRIPFHYWYFDSARNSFGHPEGLTPNWLVLTQSPLRTYASAAGPLRQLANERYDLVFTVKGTSGAAGSAVYDLQDAFFMPLSGFHTVERPGPTILIYRRRE
jgi:hypothetical protein